MNNHDSENHTEEEMRTEDESKNDSGNFSDHIRSNSANGNNVEDKKLANEECWQEVNFFAITNSQGGEKMRIYLRLIFPT